MRWSYCLCAVCVSATVGHSGRKTHAYLPKKNKKRLHSLMITINARHERKSTNQTNLKCMNFFDCKSVYVCCEVRERETEGGKGVCGRKFPYLQIGILFALHIYSPISRLRFQLFASHSQSHSPILKTSFIRTLCECVCFPLNILFLKRNDCIDNPTERVSEIVDVVVIIATAAAASNVVFVVVWTTNLFSNITFIKWYYSTLHIPFDEQTLWCVNGMYACVGMRATREIAIMSNTHLVRAGAATTAIASVVAIFSLSLSLAPLVHGIVVVHFIFFSIARSFVICIFH